MESEESKILPFFVYGTLLPGQPNADIWGESVVSIEAAVLQHGRLYDFGNYPMLVEADGESVVGALFTIRAADYPAVVTRLDRLEGYFPDRPRQSDYQRVERAVKLADGRVTPAWVYIGQEKFVRGLPIVPDGDWVTHFQQKGTTIEAWWRNISSVAGRHQRPEDDPD